MRLRLISIHIRFGFLNISIYNKNVYSTKLVYEKFIYNL